MNHEHVWEIDFGRLGSVEQTDVCRPKVHKKRDCFVWRSYDDISADENDAKDGESVGMLLNGIWLILSQLRWVNVFKQSIKSGSSLADDCFLYLELGDSMFKQLIPHCWE